MKTRYRAGIAGAGMMGQLHADALNRLPDVDVVSMMSPNPESALKAAGRFGIRNTYQDFREMLDREDLDTIHICTPNNSHFEYCRMAIERGIHVFCEKPLTLTSEEGEELARLARQKGVTGAVDFNYRNNAMVQEIRERIISGDAGKIYFIHGKYLQDWLMYDSDYSWRLDRERNGDSRALADIGSHLFDTIQCAAGRKIVSVCCTLFTAIEERKRPRKAVHSFSENRGEYDLVKPDTEDGASVQFVLEDGTPGAVIVSQVCGGHKNDLAIEIECENYSMKWRQEDADKLWTGSRREGKKVIYASPGTLHAHASSYVDLPEGHAGNWRDALFNSISNFYKVLSGNEEGSITDLSDGAYIVRIIEACLKSSRSRQWENILS